MHVSEIPVQSALELAPDLSSYPLDDELVLYDARRDRTYVLNASGRQIVEACAGSGTIAEAARSLADRHLLDYDCTLEDVKSFASALGEAGLLASTAAEALTASREDDARFDEEEAAAAAWRFRQATEPA